MIVRILEAKTFPMVSLVILGAMVTAYSVRLQMKLVGLAILLNAVGLLWLYASRKDKSKKDRWLLILMAGVAFAALVVSGWMLLHDGPQPFTLRTEF